MFWYTGQERKDKMEIKTIARQDKRGGFILLSNPENGVITYITIDYKWIMDDYVPFRKDLWTISKPKTVKYMLGKRAGDITVKAGRNFVKYYDDKTVHYHESDIMFNEYKKYFDIEV